MKRSWIKKRIPDEHDADRKFSAFVIGRDKKCLKCGSTRELTCSHFFRRGHSATRFSPTNCITLCIWCHGEWEDEKDGAYGAFMVTRLGETGFAALEALSRTIVKRERAVAEALGWLL